MTRSSITEPAKPAQRARLFPLALAASLLMASAYAPLDAGMLAWFGLSPLFLATLRARRTRHAIGLGYLFGLVFWGISTTWIGTAVANWMQSPLGWAAWIGLTITQAFWFGLFAGVGWRIGRRAEGAWRVVGLAAAWTMVEWLRGQGSLAAPFVTIGYTQYRLLPLIQAADLAGVYAVSFGVALVNAALAEWMERRNRLRQAAPAEEPVSGGVSGLADVRVCLLPPLLYLTALLLYGAVSLMRSYDGEPITVAVMQPNLVSERRAPRSVEADLALFARMTAQADGKPRLFVWPESASPGDAIHDGVIRYALEGLARQSGAYHLFGTGSADAQGREYNSAVLISPEGRLIARYDKMQLVPYGEFTPGRAILAPLNSIFPFVEDTVRGDSHAPLTAGPVRIGVLICFESLFPAISRARIRHQTNLMLLITNDSWSGRSGLLGQHFSMTTLRAVETRRYYAVSATTGITGVIAPTGRAVTVAPYRAQSLTAEARLREGETLYVRWGDWFVGVCALMLCGAFWRRKRENREV
jgi:apolipoprotein N-acyltransferase